MELTTEEELTQAINKKETILVDFYGDNCAPCKAIAATLAGVEEELGIHVAKFNVASDEYKTAAKLGIRTVPTLILFKNGEPLGRRTGTASGGEIKRWVAETN